MTAVWKGGSPFVAESPFPVRDMLISHSAALYTRPFPSWSVPRSADDNDVLGTMSCLGFSFLHEIVAMEFLASFIAHSADPP